MILPTSAISQPQDGKREPRAHPAPTSAPLPTCLVEKPPSKYTLSCATPSSIYNHSLKDKIMEILHNHEQNTTTHIPKSLVTNGGIQQDATISYDPACKATLSKAF